MAYYEGDKKIAENNEELMDYINKLTGETEK